MSVFEKFWRGLDFILATFATFVCGDSCLSQEVVSGPKTKTRKKKAKQQHQQQQQQQQPPAATTVSVGGASKDKDSAWNDIFTLPARKGLKHKASHLDEEQRKSVLLYTSML